MRDDLDRRLAEKEEKERRDEANDNRQFYDRGSFWGLVALFAFVYLWFKYMV